VNDTIVVFDRIRENIRNRGSAHFSDVINEAINQTLSRTVITSVLTFLSAAALFFFGGPVLRPFSFVMMFGIIVGTYSSIFIASPLLVIWQKLFPKKGEAARRGKPGDAHKAAARASRA
jgi:preprotein translocase subunit SecF